jgi:HTH-type transcriptional repressor of NAD biosynthesis genes
MTDRIGLTLGKFAPFHHGHELVVRTALTEVDHLILMIYDCPETTPIPLAARAQWISDLYPRVEVIQATNAPVDVGDTPEIKRAQEDFILRTLAGRRVTHFYSSEFYGAHVSAALGAIDRRVDPERRTVPVSATAIRSDPYGHRHLVAPRVYRDLVCNVAVLGAPSTGKTTLCEALARACATRWMPEYGREYWERHQRDRRLTPEQLLHIAEEHLRQEDALLLASNRYLFTDTNALTTLLFARHYHARALPPLVELADRTAQRYRHTFVCADDIPYQQTWDRSGAANRATMQCWTLEELQRRGIPFIVVKGSVEQRVQQVLKAIG